jgi:hypothetical protein
MQGCLTVDHGGEELGLHELIDSLETLAFRAAGVAGTALMVEEHFQIVSKLVHGREPILSRTRSSINSSKVSKAEAARMALPH